MKKIAERIRRWVEDVPYPYIPDLDDVFFLGGTGRPAVETGTAFKNKLRRIHGERELWGGVTSPESRAVFTRITHEAWGRRQVSLSSPLSITANTVYIVSFSTGLDSGVTSGPLEALADNNSISPGDGVYSAYNPRRSSAAAFPGTSGGGMNFYADLVFNPTMSGSTVIGHSSARGIGRGIGVRGELVSMGIGVSSI